MRRILPRPSMRADPRRSAGRGAAGRRRPPDRSGRACPRRRGGRLGWGIGWTRRRRRRPGPARSPAPAGARRTRTSPSRQPPCLGQQSIHRDGDRPPVVVVPLQQPAPEHRRMQRAVHLAAQPGWTPNAMRRTARTRGRVHPRVCGETSTTAPRRVTARGPSPRVRETRVVKPRLRVPRGPSPRVRGNRVPSAGTLASRRSIPACAGKPRGHASANSAGAVHPRVCGETIAGSGVGSGSRGPSPRVRGNRVALQVGRLLGGSIPACAGKPSRGPAPSPRPGVHPRVCGETHLGVHAGSGLGGPSPRVRGNPSPPTTPSCRSGSIPACAGKPSCTPLRGSARRVHPRVCGETWSTPTGCAA